MALPNDYWSAYEHSISTLAEALEAMRMISAYRAATGARFVWRGVTDASWPLHSSLARAYIRLNRSVPNEVQLRDLERGVLDEAFEWGLDWHSNGGRLRALELLAALQHYGVPTRMLDFTFNPLIALWFAVEGRDARPGRLFAIDVSQRLVDRAQAERATPWWWEIAPGVATTWARGSWIWQPPPLDPRIVRQEGCFLMGGVPSTIPARSIRVGGRTVMLRANQIRECMSVPFVLISYQQAVAAFEGRALRGAAPSARAFTLRVINKGALRQELEQTFGYTYRSLFPDFPGFASHGRSFR